MTVANNIAAPLSNQDELSQEEWRAIPGYEGLYEVSNLGRVKSLARVVPHTRNGSYPVKERILAAGLSGPKRERLMVGLALSGVQRTYPVARLVHLAFIGPIPDGFDVDHRDRNPLNNSPENLRACTPSQNLANRSVDDRNTSGFKGVRFDKNGCKKRVKNWRARIKVNGKEIYLGHFLTAEEAAAAYAEGAKKYFGEFARTV